MKKYMILSVLCLLMSDLLSAQTTPYNVVFDLTSKDSIDQKAVIRWLNEITESHPDAKLEVVLYGQSLDFVTKGKSIAPEVITAFSKNKNVAINACAIAMKNHNIDKSQLVEGVGTVPDGIYEIISRQSQGWGYIKAAR
jgi:intracellular sulfur oxidation DsrE/DsrF family protein